MYRFSAKVLERAPLTLLEKGADFVKQFSVSVIPSPEARPNNRQ